MDPLSEDPRLLDSGVAAWDKLEVPDRSKRDGVSLWQMVRSGVSALVSTNLAISAKALSSEMVAELGKGISAAVDSVVGRIALEALIIEVK